MGISRAHRFRWPRRPEGLAVIVIDESIGDFDCLAVELEGLKFPAAHAGLQQAKGRLAVSRDIGQGIQIQGLLSECCIGSDRLWNSSFGHLRMGDA